MTRILIKLNTCVKTGLDWKKWTKINITEKELNFELNSLGYHIPSVALLLKALKENIFLSNGLSSESEEKRKKKP